MTPATLAVAGTIAGVLVLGLAARRRWLTRSGIIAAGLVGIGVTWGVGLPGLALLVFFFVTSSALTRVLRRREPRSEADSDRLGRTAAQVFANAGVATAAAVAARWSPGSEVPFVAFAGALAAATADTWASEVGEWRAGRTRLVTTWRRVDSGADGGVSWFGSVAAAAASLAVAGLAALLFTGVDLVLPVAAGGMFGMVADSIAGATVQGRVSWVRNDVVNWLGTAAGAATAIILG